jgi:hypothetical protein
MSAQGRRSKRARESFIRGPGRLYLHNGSPGAAPQNVFLLSAEATEEARRKGDEYRRSIYQALGVILLACCLLVGCDVTGDDQVEPDAGGADAAVCKNAFDDRCAATNGCGVAGAFCCYHFGEGGAVTSVCLAASTTCESDICVVSK